MFTGFQMLMPTMPVYVEFLGGRETIMGVVTGLFTLSAVGVRPVVGWALDTLGRKAVFLLGLAVFVVSALSYAWAPSIAVLLAIRVLHGLGWGCSTTAAGTIAADVIPRERLGEGMGFFGLAATIAMAVAPALGLFIIHQSGFTALFATSASLALAALALAAAIRYGRYRLLPASPGTNPTTGPAEGSAGGRAEGSAGGSAEGSAGEPADGSGGGPAAPPAPTPAGGGTRAAGLAARAAFLEPRAVRPGVVMLLCNTTYGAIVTFLALYALQRGIANIGPFFTVYAGTLALTRPLAGALIDRRGYDAAVVPGLLAVAATMFVLSRAVTLPTFLAAAVCAGIGFGAVGPAMQALAVRGLPPYRRGAANSTYYIGFDLGIGLGAILWGSVSQAVGYAAMYLTATIPAGLALLVYVIIGRHQDGHPGGPHPPHASAPR